MQRREHGRYRLWFPVRLSGGELDGMAVSQNVSAGGMLIALSAKLEEGQPVSVRFQVPPGSGEEQQLTGTVARVEPNADDPDGMWPYRLAVAFDTADPELIALLEQAAQYLATRD